ncbi:general secretion pathway protein GspK [Rubritalea tangerina]|uniref:General secretion pathway protein GspK n=2 Tax=Rubritalea tangerina TaxID=430798 RepID=A0ABW4ZBM4_9BACT
MTSLLVVTLTMLKVDVDDNVAEVHSFTAWQQAHTGLSYGLHPGIERDDPILQGPPAEYDEGYAVVIEPEAARLNINAVLSSQDKGALTNLFKIWGLEDREVDQLVDALTDWVDGDELISLNGAEAEYYRELGYLDRPYNRPFRDLDELQLVRGFYLVEELKPDWREFFTLWSQGPLDIHEAHPELLAAAAEVEVSIAAEFRAFVAGDDGMMGTEDDIRFESVGEALDDMASPPGYRDTIAQRFTLNGSILRIESVGYSGSFQYLIRAISGAKGGQSGLLEYQEKQLTSE